MRFRLAGEEEVDLTTLKALEIFFAQTLCATGILLSLVSASLHLGRAYCSTVHARFPLRVSSDTWWLLYLGCRDGSLLGAAVLGLAHLNLDLMADIKVGLPFVPFGTVALVAALVVRALFERAAVAWPPRLASALVVTGAALNLLGYVLVMEAPGDEYVAARSLFWSTLRSWRSNANPELSAWVFAAAWATLGVVTLASLLVASRRAAPSAADERRPLAKLPDVVASGSG